MKAILVLVLVLTTLAFAGWAASDFRVDLGVRHADQNMRERPPLFPNVPTIDVPLR